VRVEALAMAGVAVREVRNERALAKKSVKLTQATLLGARKSLSLQGIADPTRRGIGRGRGPIADVMVSIRRKLATRKETYAYMKKTVRRYKRIAADIAASHRPGTTITHAASGRMFDRFHPRRPVPHPVPPPKDAAPAAAAAAAAAAPAAAPAAPAAARRRVALS
jgi:hypothetical protein